MSTDAEIAVAARNAGFEGDNLVLAVAVALAESGGNQLATNKNSNGSVDYGLWQINSVHQPELKSGNWWVPSDNAKMAFSIWSKNHSWTPWVAYTKGMHTKFLGRAQAATGIANLSNVDGILSTVSTGLVPVGLSDFSQLADLLQSRQTWVRVGYIFAGAALLFIVVLAVLKDTPVGDAAKAAVKVGAKVV